MIGRALERDDLKVHAIVARARAEGRDHDAAVRDYCDGFNDAIAAVNAMIDELTPGDPPIATAPSEDARHAAKRAANAAYGKVVP